MANPIRKLYDWTLRIAAHKHATWGLAGISFAESSFFPIPPDVVLLPMCIADQKKSFRYATICTVSSVIGGLLGYAIGYFLYDTIGIKIVEMYHYQEAFEALKEKYNEYGVWIIIAKGMTPIPYKIVTIASGVAAFPVWKFGAPIQVFVEKYLTLLTMAFLALLIGGFIALKYI